MGGREHLGGTEDEQGAGEVAHAEEEDRGEEPAKGGRERPQAGDEWERRDRPGGGGPDERGEAGRRQHTGDDGPEEQAAEGNRHEEERGKQGAGDRTHRVQGPMEPERAPDRFGGDRVGKHGVADRAARPSRQPPQGGRPGAAAIHRGFGQ